MTPATHFSHLALSSHPPDKKNSPFLPPRRHISGMQNSILERHLDVGLSMRQMREEGWLTSLSPEDPDHPSLFFHARPLRGWDGWRGGMEAQGSFHDETQLLPFRMSRIPGKRRIHRGPCKYRMSNILAMLQTRQTETQWEKSDWHRDSQNVTSGREVTELLPTTYLFWEVKILMSELWSGPGFPSLWDLMPDDPRWSWCNNNRSKVHNKCNVLESSWNRHHSPPHPWKNCLPWN